MPFFDPLEVWKLQFYRNAIQAWCQKGLSERRR